ENAEDREGREALRGRRKAHRDAATVRHAQRLHPVRAMAHEILETQRTAGGGRGGDEASPERASIELRRSALRERVDRGREVRLDETPALETGGMVDRPQGGSHFRRRAVGKEGGGGRRGPPLTLGERDALAR